MDSTITKLFRAYVVISALAFSQAHAGDPKGGIIVKSDNNAPISEQLKRTFSSLTEKEVPTKTLLQAGSIFYDEHILKLDGSLDSFAKNSKMLTLSSQQYMSIYAELHRSALQRSTLLAPSKIRKKAQEYWANGIYPISISVIDYNSLSPEKLAFEEAYDKSGLYIAEKGIPVSGTHTMVAASVLAPTVYGGNPTFIIPSSLVNVPDVNAIGGLSINFGGETYSVEIDQPFSVDGLQDGPAQFELEIEYSDGVTGSDGPVRDDPGPEGPPRDGIEPEKHHTKGGFVVITTRSDDCYDLGEVTADVSFTPSGGTPQLGAINLRVYPANGTVESDGDGSSSCKDGSEPKLKRILVVVPGIDVNNVDTQDSIYQQFGERIDGFVELGFDVVVVDYNNGATWIEVNANALRKLVVDVLPDWLADDADPRFAVLGASMGAMVTRHALTSAELAGENHNTELYISLDGPHAGANIPIGIQNLVAFLAPEDEGAEAAKNALNGPAASQLLLTGQPFGFSPDVPGYSPKPEFTAFFNSISSLGMPTNSRNIAASNGSGVGLFQNGTGLRDQFNFVHWQSSFIFTFGQVTLDAHTDHFGQFFYGKIKKFLFERFLSLGFGPSSSPLALDVAPGGFSETPLLVTSLYNGSSGAKGTMISPLPQHNFVPTTSALGAPFDQVFAEKCNTRHVFGSTPDLFGFLIGELIAFRDGTTPPTTNLPVNPCGVPEPGDFPPVVSCAATPSSGYNPLTVQFSAAASFDPDGDDLVSYHWTFGDGSTTTTSTPEISHTYTSDTSESSAVFFTKLNIVDETGASTIGSCGPIELSCHPLDPNCNEI